MALAPVTPIRPRALPADGIIVRPWEDPVVDLLGHDPRSAYVERFWLGILGPSTTWLLRRLAGRLESSPAGFPLEIADTAAALGLRGHTGRGSPFMRALNRCCQFHLARVDDVADTGEMTLGVRRKLPPLNRRQVARLSPSVREDHARWQEETLRIPAVEALRRRARRLALSLLELGEDNEGTERQLLRWRFHPALAREATAWAFARHRLALAAARGEDS